MNRGRRPPNTWQDFPSKMKNGYPSKTPPEGVAGVRSVRHVELPHVPIKWERGKHTRPHFFGWPVTWEWLELFRKCARLYSKHRFGGHVYALLRELSGAGSDGFDLNIRVAVHEGVPLQLNDKDDEFPPKELRFEMVAIRDTLTAECYFGTRPTEAQYDWLDSILPGQAQWYKSIWTRQSIIELEM
ncbi:uncharacterized protein TRAVEDRAFT_53083 [Trametes versicolor FP-101664 SS1]|uniref:uncharacterized protein n=1 Tax=Trametes versicolor (strain FP-101664) TaxID=717944 RepID=UPI0004621A89|nr:uncharacterized protein TRAVEDRAFT_53083 [Trametes versicolor FP-101664 SS1]EIW52642.1 hypothetical protein TRAVEDRAFT_53083 [Trametes versicolor FP-101664 SS1]